GFICAGHGCRIAAGSHVENCILLDGADVGPNEFHINEIIGYDYSVHRDFAILKQLQILDGIDWHSCKISSLREYGSARGFFRLTDYGRRVLMVSDASDVDFDRFVDLGQFLARNRLYTPEIYDFNRGEYTVMMEDLGNVMLFNRWAEAPGDLTVLTEYYRKVINALIDFQLRGTLAFRQPDAPPLRVFDYDYLRWETSYFTKNLLYGVCGLSRGDTPGLEEEFDALAAAVDAHPKVYMHRDFQSQNIMMYDGKPRFVDFQGSRLGPVGYDIMSLLRDPYVRLPHDLTVSLLGYYIERFMASPLNEYVRTSAQFRIYAVLAGLQRRMQALGAYGFLALVKGKAHYLDFIPQAVEYLRSDLDDLQQLRCGIELRALENCWDAVAETAQRLKRERG
ncbi:MAG: phosphotransferase, partial [Victivallales bacterium]|nr:phosphotransferase [Victivallales bacterium]